MHADPDVELGCLPSWHWMPYQKAQAEKQEAKTAASDIVTLTVGGRTTGDDAMLRHKALDYAIRAHAPAACAECILPAARDYLAFLKGEEKEGS